MGAGGGGEEGEGGGTDLKWGAYVLSPLLRCTRRSNGTDENRVIHWLTANDVTGR